MIKEFECKNLFNKAIEEGINLFLGAGFSVNAKDGNGNALPLGGELLEELKDKFQDIKVYNDLSKACTKLKNTHKEEFYEFLEERFNVVEYDSRYDAIKKINTKNIYTTNIDNLLYKILDNGNKYLYDRSKKGAGFKETSIINYFPLHGCINNHDDYVFGTTELATAFSKRSKEESWKCLAEDASNKAILFWGWNFQDTGPIEAMYVNEKKVNSNINKWVLLYEPTEETKDFLKTLQFNIIEADTEELLQYIDEYITSKIHINTNYDNNYINSNVKKYCAPKNDKDLKRYPLQMMFLDYMSRWSHIYSNQVPRTKKYKQIAETILSEKNIIIYGIRGSGKSTLLRQLLIYLDSNREKTYLEAPSVEMARQYIKDVNETRVIVFIDDCFRDTDAILEICKHENIQIVAFDRDFSYESQFSKLPKEKFCEPIDTTEIDIEDAQSILNIIPNEIKKTNSSTKNFHRDPTIPNLLAASLHSLNFNYFNRFMDNAPKEAEVFLMICYVHSCGVPCSFDMVYSYLGEENYTWKQMREIIDRIGGLIKDNASILGSYSIDFENQDYYECRSRFFAEKILESIPKKTSILSTILMTFAENVPVYKICWYDKFKRSAYDADLATKAFPRETDGEKYYNICRGKDETEYVYQQAALYFSRRENYPKAFEWIDKARNISHYNRFSIDSTYAKLYFDVNKNTDKNLALEALRILSDCCKKDKRKSIHFLTYANCVLEFYKIYGNEGTDILGKEALMYIEDGLSEGNWSLSKKNQKALKSVRVRLKEYME